jgi:hypothetical protein
MNQSANLSRHALIKSSICAAHDYKSHLSCLENFIRGTYSNRGLHPEVSIHYDLFIERYSYIQLGFSVIE